MRIKWGHLKRLGFTKKSQYQVLKGVFEVLWTVI